jgi:hypothetical protein
MTDLVLLGLCCLIHQGSYVIQRHLQQEQQQQQTAAATAAAAGTVAAH